MSKKNHPLDEEFDIAAKVYSEEEAEILIPDDPNLDTIIEFALKAYKEQMDSLMLIEPKNRVRYLEVCERFLSEAKDAIYKKDYIKLQREKLTKGVRTPTSGGVAGESDSEGSQEEDEGTDRAELFSLVKGGKKD